MLEFGSPHGGSWLSLLAEYGFLESRCGEPAILVVDCFGMMHERDQRQAVEERAAALHSDGTLVPAEVVARAEQAGVELLALTDHDTVDGVDEALQATTHLKLVPAVELSLLLLLEPVLSSVWAWVVLDERLHAWSIAGAATILGATVADVLTRDRVRPTAS